MTIEHYFIDYFKGKKVTILGYGQEGQSTLRRLREYLPQLKISVCDQNPLHRVAKEHQQNDSQTHWFIGEDYLKGLIEADIIIKSPGIPFDLVEGLVPHDRITSQSALFLNFFRKQVVGVTGTKGKSTTASLIYHMFREAKKEVLLAGNIGMPCFELFDNMSPAVTVVFEMSSHQLQHLKVSPAVAVLLNIYEEHLDYYRSFAAYQEAKMQIFRWQESDDFFVYNPANKVLGKLIPPLQNRSSAIRLGRPMGKQGGIYCIGNDMVYVSVPGADPIVVTGVCKDRMLAGEHNLQNIAAAVAVGLIKGLSPVSLSAAVASFPGLPHRLEFVGSIQGRRFYNDSIATIPEACMAAIKSIDGVSALILAGKDRGVAYGPLISFLAATQLDTIVFTGEAGRRMYAIAADTEGMQQKRCLWADTFEEAVTQAFYHTPEGAACLLSPAAPSYDAFRSFEERGDAFKNILYGLGDD